MDKIISYIKSFKNRKKNSYEDDLKIPFFNLTFCSDKILVDSLKMLTFTSDPLAIECGKIMPCDDRNLTNQSVCYILVWSSDIDKGWNSRGLGLYNGSSFVTTAKHVLENDKCHENDNIYVLFPTFEFCLIYKAQKIFPKNPLIPLNYDIAFIELQGCLDPLQNMKVEIGELHENEMLYFDILELGCFVRKYCKLKKTNTNMISHMSSKEHEFVISKAGKKGDSGTPIYSSSGTCVGLYIGQFKAKNSLNHEEYGRGLQFDRILLNTSDDFLFFQPSSLIKNKYRASLGGEATEPD